MANQTNSMAHTKWMCKYHIVFTPKYRRKVIYNQYKEDIRDIIKILCKYKGVEIIEGHLMPDHIHMLVSIPPKYSISQFMGYLKGKSALMIYDKHANVTVHSYLVPVTIPCNAAIFPSRIILINAVSRMIHGSFSIAIFVS